MLNNLEQRESKSVLTFSRNLSNSKAFQLTSGLAFVLGLTILGMTLSLQGWRSLIPAFDMLTYFDNAYDLLYHGILPEHGDISSYGSFSPPGTSWLIAFGMFFFDDPRLYEKAGSALLHFGTLWGLFLLTRRVFGTWPAYFAVLIYGLSVLGLDYAGSLWPIGHPFFYVWMVYFVLFWAKYKEGKYLTLAVITWAIGMNVDMAIAPALFILPAIWFFFRPPVFSKSLFLGFIVTFLVWYPYLKFESERAFIDLKSQLSRQSVFPANYLTSWCNPYLVIEKSNHSSNEPITVSDEKASAQTISSIWLRRFVSLKNRIAEGLLSNFNQATSIPSGNLFLLLGVVSNLLLLNIAAFLPRIKKQGNNIPTSQPVVTRIYHWVNISITSQYREDRLDGGRLLALSLSIPWLILILLAEPGRLERFTWLWPLQLLVLTAFTTHFLSHLPMPRIIAYTSQVMLLILLLPLSSLPAKFENWAENGWAGQEADEMQVVDYLANQLETEGRPQAPIGYKIFIYPFMADYNIINPRYKVGAEFDLLFKYQYGIVNTTKCAEGFSSQDEYRVVQTMPKNDLWAPRDYFNVSLINFKLIHQFGSYEIFKRQ